MIKTTMVALKHSLDTLPQDLDTNLWKLGVSRTFDTRNYGNLRY